MSETTVVAKCNDCGIRYDLHGLDCVLPREQWELICPEGGVLCGRCIAMRASKWTAATVIRMRLEGLSDLCDAADRAETLAYENHLLRRGHDDDRAEVDRLQAQLIEVTREKDLEAALAPLQAVVRVARSLVDEYCAPRATWQDEPGLTREADRLMDLLGAALSALPADPSAPTPR